MTESEREEAHVHSRLVLLPACVCLRRAVSTLTLSVPTPTKGRCFGGGPFLHYVQPSPPPAGLAAAERLRVLQLPWRLVGLADQPPGLGQSGRERPGYEPAPGADGGCQPRAQLLLRGKRWRASLHGESRAGSSRGLLGHCSGCRRRRPGRSPLSPSGPPAPLGSELGLD